MENQICVVVNILKDNKSKLNRLFFIGFIKYIAMLMIIRVHIYSFNERAYARRACEFLFVSSGFLVGYNYIYKNVPDTFEYSFKYYYKHLKDCYPLYLINFIYGVFSNRKYIKFSLTTIELIIINIFMLQIWSRHRNLAPFFNAISWFLHDLLICYLISPLLLKGINSIKKSLIFILFYLIY